MLRGLVDVPKEVGTLDTKVAGLDANLVRLMKSIRIENYEDKVSIAVCVCTCVCLCAYVDVLLLFEMYICNHRFLLRFVIPTRRSWSHWNKRKPIS